MPHEECRSPTGNLVSTPGKRVRGGRSPHLRTATPCITGSVTEPDNSTIHSRTGRGSPRHAHTASASAARTSSRTMRRRSPADRPGTPPPATDVQRILQEAPHCPHGAQLHRETQAMMIRSAPRLSGVCLISPRDSARPKGGCLDPSPTAGDHRVSISSDQRAGLSRQRAS
jgi:hypothetical protein